MAILLWGTPITPWDGIPQTTKEVSFGTHAELGCFAQTRYAVMTSNNILLNS